MRPLVPSLAVLILAQAVAQAPRGSGAWDGVWRLDPAHSQLTGESFTYARQPDGTWLVANGGPIRVHFGCDGRPYRSFSDDETVSCTPDGPRAWTQRRQYKGMTFDVTREELAADGDTLTDRETLTNPDHSVSRVTTIYTREGAGTGFAGRWRSRQIIGRYRSGWVFANRFAITTTGPRTMRWAMPDDDMQIEGAVDGSPLPIRTPGGPPDTAGVAVRLRRVSPREFRMAVWRDHKEERDYRLTLAADGRTFTAASWAPGKEHETRIARYEKQ